MAGEDEMDASPGADREMPDPGGIGDQARVSATQGPTPALEPVAAGSVRSADPDAGPMLGVHCPFLASIDVEDRIRRATPAPDTANRCLSTGGPVAPSARDQAALCLSGEHQACPRYVHATAGPRDAAPAAAHGPRISAPIAAAMGVLVLAAVLAGASLAANGDLSIGLGAASAGATPAAASPAAGVGPGASLAVGPAGSGAPSLPAVAPASALPAPTEAPSLAVTTPALPASPTPRPSATPKRYPGLTPCPGRDDCYIYVVKRGDRLAAVAARYGLTLDEVLARNPKIRDPGLIVLGQKIRLPTPRR